MIISKEDFNRKQIRICQAELAWKKIVKRFGIDETTVILVLSGENFALDNKALEHLKYYIKKRKANRAEILVCNSESYESVNNFIFEFPVNVTLMDKEELQSLFEYYCFTNNMTNIAFTFLKHVEYNHLGRIVEEKDFSMNEIVDLGVYWLREVIED